MYLSLKSYAKAFLHISVLYVSICIYMKYIKQLHLLYCWKTWRKGTSVMVKSRLHVCRRKGLVPSLLLTFTMQACCTQQVELRDRH